MPGAPHSWESKLSRTRALCAGGCGSLLAGGAESLPPGQRTCLSCRRARKVRTCEVCDSDYRPTYGQQRTCGRTCGWQLRLREGKVGKTRSPIVVVPDRLQACRTCGATYMRSTGVGAYCQTRCWMDDVLKRPCVECGSRVDVYRRKCDDCLSRTRGERRRRGKRRRRAAELGVAHEPYTLTEIAERDRHLCGLCHRRVAMKKAVPHPKAPTIDHIVPIADGGDDVRSNVQLAHFLCNSLKGIGGTQQLLLVG